jgi:2-methylcitrate dehydratase PrpD
VIAEFLADIRAIASGALPADVRAIAKCCIFDWFGVALAGAREPLSAMLLAELLTSPDAPCSLIGRPERSTAHAAALFNGAASDALDFSDTNRTLNGHATATVFPAALAMAERTGASGEALLRAFVAGVEAACRVGALLGPGVLDTPHHPTAVSGPLGAATAAALLLQLDDAGFAAALSIAGTQAAGLSGAVGTMSKALHAGTAAAAGTLAAGLAARGFTGVPDVLDPNGGFLRTHTSAVNTGALAAVRGRFLIRDTLFKAHAACALAHGSIDNMLGLKHAHGFAAADVAAVALHIPATSARICDIVEPRTGLEAKFSVRTVVAMALLGYDTGSLTAFAGGIECAPDVAALRERIAVTPRADLHAALSRATVSLHDGRTFEAVADERIIDRDLQRRRSNVRAKFHALTAAFVTAAAAADLEERIFPMDTDALRSSHRTRIDATRSSD